MIVYTLYIVQCDLWPLHNAIFVCHRPKHILDANLRRSISKCFVYLAIWPFQHWNEMREKAT